MSQIAKQTMTAADIARHLGLSQTTVSAVLRGHAQRRRISSETCERVLKAVSELDYVPNQMARNLRRQRSGMVGVVVGNFSWGWTEALVGGMLEVFRPGDYTPFVAIHEFDCELSRRELLSCLQRRDEGVICQPLPELNEVCARIRHAGLPLIFLGDRPADIPEASCVAWDAGPAARLAVQHLVETGRRRIAFVGMDYPMQGNLARNEAYLSVLRESGLPRDDRWMAIWPYDTPLDQIVSGSVDQMFAPECEHPDAIFCVHDAAAVSLLDTLSARGIRVPEDVAVMGLGDLPLTGHSAIGLSTVREPVEEMGREAAQMMLDLIADTDRAPIHRLIPGQELKVRRTTAGEGWSLASA